MFDLEKAIAEWRSKMAVLQNDSAVFFFLHLHPKSGILAAKLDANAQIHALAYGCRFRGGIRVTGE